MAKYCLFIVFIVYLKMKMNLEIECSNVRRFTIGLSIYQINRGAENELD